MHVTINGQDESLPGEASVADLLAARDLSPIRVAVEINEELVPRAVFSKTRINAGDRKTPL